MVPGGVEAVSPGSGLGAGPSVGLEAWPGPARLRVEPDHPGRTDLGFGTPRHGGSVGPLLRGFGRGRFRQKLEEAIAAVLSQAQGGQLPSQSRILPRHPLFVGGGVGIDECADATRLDLGHQDPEPGLARRRLVVGPADRPGGLFGPSVRLLDDRQSVGTRGGGVQSAAVIGVEPGGVHDQGIAAPSFGESDAPDRPVRCRARPAPSAVADAVPPDATRPRAIPVPRRRPPNIPGRRAAPPGRSRRDRDRRPRAPTRVPRCRPQRNAARAGPGTRPPDPMTSSGATTVAGRSAPAGRAARHPSSRRGPSPGPARRPIAPSGDSTGSASSSAGSSGSVPINSRTVAGRSGR